MIEHFIDARGTALRRDIVRGGLDDTVILRAINEDLLVRIHHGATCRKDVWEEADPREKHRLRSHVVRRLYGDDVARSHSSAVLELGGPDWGVDLRTVHLTNLFGIGERTQSTIAHHRGAVYVADLTRHDGSWLTAPARSALDAAALAARDPAVCILNWVQASGHATREDLEIGIDRMKEWPHTIGLGLKLRLTNGKSESVGEVRSDLLCRDQRLPLFVPQFEIFHPSGKLAGRVDGAWPEHRTMFEFDGLAKYLRLRRPGETIEQCVIREKLREDLLRRLTGWTMIRITWADLERPVETAAMIRRSLLDSAA